MWARGGRQHRVAGGERGVHRSQMRQGIRVRRSAPRGPVQRFGDPACAAEPASGHADGPVPESGSVQVVTRVAHGDGLRIGELHRPGVAASHPGIPPGARQRPDTGLGEGHRKQAPGPVLEAGGYQRVAAESGTRTPHLCPAQRKGAPGIGGRHDRVGGLGRPNTPQLTQVRRFAPQLVEDGDRIHVGLGDPGGNDVILGQFRQALPAFGRSPGRGQGHLESPRVEPVPDHSRRHAQSPATALPSCLR